MSNSQNPDDKRAKLPQAMPVKLETLQKVKVDVMELPEILFEEAPSESEEGSPEEESEEDEPFLETPVAVTAGSSSRGGASLNRKALESTNRGKTPKSRFFVRGILHPSPFKVAFAAFFAIFARVAFLAALVLLVLFLLGRVEARFIWFSLLAPLAALIHLASAHSARCRVCGQKVFLPSGARKHVRTHRFLFFGPIVSTAFHLLLFKWFRCLFCGTPVRIRK